MYDAIVKGRLNNIYACLKKSGRKMFFLVAIDIYKPRLESPKKRGVSPFPLILVWL